MRRSGKTFRAILRSLEMASSGKFVIHSTNNIHWATDCAKAAFSMTSIYCGDDVIFHQGSRMISFPNGGYVKFSGTDIDHVLKGGDVIVNRDLYY